MLSQPLLVFLTVAEEGSFTQAAKKLMVTPASVMKHMNHLEDQLGVQLVTRSRQGARLTAAGEVLYEEGKHLRSASETALQRVRSAGRSASISLRVGSSLLNPSRVLSDHWAPLAERHPEFRFRIVPYEDTKEQILTLIASLGERIDLLVGSFNSRTMRAQANYLPLGDHHYCIAVPKGHPLASRQRLTLNDLHGQRLLMVTSGDTDLIDDFAAMLARDHPEIQTQGVGYYYDMDTFNTCEEENAPLLTLDAWADLHPALVTLPLDCDTPMPYGVLYAKEPSPDVARFIQILAEHTANAR